MGGIYVDFSVVNQLNSPALNSNVFANRPAAGQAGRLFISTDTFEIYRDNGTTWDLIGGPGSSTVTGSGAATQVAFWNGSQIITGNNNLWFDPVSIELGVGTNTPNGIINTVGTDKFGILSEINTISGTAANTVALYGLNNTNAFGYAGVFEEKTPNNASGQYPVMIKSTLSSGVGAINMATGLHFGLPDDSGTDLLVSQIGITTTNATAGSYSNRINFSLRNNGAFATPFAITADGIGVNVLAPSGLIHADGGTNVARIILDSDNNIARIFSFRTDNLQRWALRVDGNESGSNAGANFQLRRYDDAGNFIDASLIVNRATGKKTFNATENYTTGLATGNSFGYTLNVPAGTTFSNPNSITALQTSIVLNLAGNATVQSGSRFGLDAYNFIGFSNTGTLTANQAGTLRAIANARTGWAFNGAATGTITHLAGLNIIRPDNTGAAMAVTNNYGILINNQDTGSGTVTYTNRWGIYQEGSADNNFLSAKLLLGSAVDNGNKLQVAGEANISGFLAIGVTSTTSKFELNDGTGVNLQIGRQANNRIYLRNYNATSGFREMQLFGSDLTFWTGTAGGAIATQRVLIDAAGTFLINGASSAFGYASGYSLGVKGTNAQAFVSIARQSQTLDSQGMIIGLDTASGQLTMIDNLPLTFATNNIQRMSITSGGSVNIGGNYTSTSKILLATGGNGNQFAIDNTGQRYTQMDLNNNGTQRGYLAIDNTNNEFQIYGQSNVALALGAGGGERIRITSGGNMLLGQTTDTGQRLQVNGNSLFTHSSGNDVQLTVKSAGIAAAYIRTDFSLVSYGGFAFDYNSTNYWYIGAINGDITNALSFYSSNGTERIKMHANGGMRFVPQSAAPTAEAGTVYYDSDDNKLKVYNGTSWIDLH